jgi:thymidylate kinase
MNQLPKTVVFLGPDGAGKTTLLNLVEDGLQSREIDFERYYFAPGYLKRYRPSGTPTVNTNPHEGRQYGAGLVLLKVLLMLFEFNMGLPKVKRRNTLVLFDRFIHDLLVDPQRYRMGRVRWWMRVLLNLAPRPDLVVIITAPPEVIQARKQEVPPEETARQVAAYRQAARLFPRAVEVDNTGTPEITVRRIMDEILDDD